MFTDEYYMKMAFQEAEIALEKDEVPIGCVIVSNNRVIARAHNLTETLNDVTAHAEMQAITSAANFLGGKYLKKLYTLCDIGTLRNVFGSSLLVADLKSCNWSPR